MNDPGPHLEENQSNHSKGLLLLELVGKNIRQRIKTRILISPALEMAKLAPIETGKIDAIKVFGLVAFIHAIQFTEIDIERIKLHSIAMGNRK